MSDQIEAPAKNPCGSCPYRKDAPSGLWAPEEYEMLPTYDGETSEQPPAVFMCHQQNGRLCAGWVGTHDMPNNLGLRVASAFGMLPIEVRKAAIEYRTDTPLFGSGAEAAVHGMRDIDNPDVRTMRIASRIETKRIRQRGKTS